MLKTTAVLALTAMLIAAPAPAAPAANKAASSSRAAKGEPRVTLDVKDMEVRPLLKNVQKQCGIKNLIVDPDVTGSGTFYFSDVPCSDAIPAILKTLGLAADIDGQYAGRGAGYAGQNLVSVEPLH